MRIFTFPWNLEAGAITYTADSAYTQGVAAPELSDGRPDTSNASAYYVVDFAGTDRQVINACFVETSGFDDITIAADTGAGGGTTITSHPIAEDAQRRGTRHYAFIPFLGNLTASRVRIAFGGGPGRVYRLALTRQLLNLDMARFTQISHRYLERGTQRRTNILGNSVVIASRAGRAKWRTDFTRVFLPDDTVTLEQFLGTAERGPNFFIYPQPDDFPTVFYPASLFPEDIAVDYIGELPTQRTARFTVQEL